jgi:hypothetical protein
VDVAAVGDELRRNLFGRLGRGRGYRSGRESVLCVMYCKSRRMPCLQNPASMLRLGLPSPALKAGLELDRDPHTRHRQLVPKPMMLMMALAEFAATNKGASMLKTISIFIFIRIVDIAKSRMSLFEQLEPPPRGYSIVHGNNHMR